MKNKLEKDIDGKDNLKKIILLMERKDAGC